MTLTKALKEGLSSTLSPAVFASGLILAFALFAFYHLVLKQHFSAFRNLPGPPKKHWLWGNMKEVLTASSPGDLQFHRGEQYGSTYKQYAIGGAIHAATSDLKAANYIFLHPDLFIKPAGGNRVLTDALGRGLVTVEGQEHRRQRRVLNPAFGWIQIQAMSPVIFEKAIALRNRLHDIVDSVDSLPAGHPDKISGVRKIDILKPLSAATLDIIALVGFGYDLHAIDDAPNELREAYTSAIGAAFSLNPLAILQLEFPAFNIIPTARKRILHDARAKAQRIGAGIVTEKKRLIGDIYDGKIDKSTDVGKDVLSLLIKSNMVPDLREDQKMSDEEIMHQISTILFAGHETTGTAMMWCLYQLALNPIVQDKLRNEVQSIDEEEPSFETLNSLPYLDKVVHESLRLETPIPLTVRIATRDAVVPLDTPIVGRDGSVIENLTVPKGSIINIPISYINSKTELWGSDSRQFNPDRWDNVHANVPGVWGNLMTFIGGPRNCIGHRLTILEMKILLFILLRSFHFGIPPSRPELKRTWLIIQRAVVIGEEDKGPQMPLMVRPL